MYRLFCPVIKWTKEVGFYDFKKNKKGWVLRALDVRGGDTIIQIHKSAIFIIVRYNLQQITQDSLTELNIDTKKENTTLTD